MSGHGLEPRIIVAVALALVVVVVAAIVGSFALAAAGAAVLVFIVSSNLKRRTLEVRSQVKLETAEGERREPPGRRKRKRRGA
jgi:energy-coupling factor transporter transmembrane protein EcfT